MTDISIREVHCTPYQDQRPGTAGLRKKVQIFQQVDYLENFVQSIFDTLNLEAGATLIVGGDGRFYNREAIHIITAMAAANNIGHLIIGQDGLLSTPAASHLIRKRHAAAGILLTASHNPGGPDGDFGIKFNLASGGQAPEQLTNAVHEYSQSISKYRITDIASPELGKTDTYAIGSMQVEIVDSVDAYAELMQELFDFEKIRAAIKSGTRLHFDALNAVTGPYAKRIFCDLLGASADSVHNAKPLEDFGGLHPDPNPVDAAHVVDLSLTDDAPDLLAASDGDGDRNMILGKGLIVSPGDSLAIMLANTQVAPGYRKKISGVARSMPTSRAVDSVAAKLGIPLYVTPTGWRYFCNLLEAGKIEFCGEESFGTSSAHTREKDGLWAVLFWLNMMASLDKSVTEIVHDHWSQYGRCFFQRRDYFISDTDKADQLMLKLGNTIQNLAANNPEIATADCFSYTDPVDGSVAANQGFRIHLQDGGRIVYRLSGTGTAGATLRVYLDKPVDQPELIHQEPNQALAELAKLAADIAHIEHFTSLTDPTAII